MERTDNWRRTFPVCVALAAVTLAAFWPVIHNGFVSYDDRYYVTENPHVLAGLTWADAGWAFRTGRSGNWHPLTWLSHMLDCQLYGLKPAGHHLTSLLLHTANTLLLFGLLKRLTGAFWRSAFVAALFALHPLHVESVAWVAERKDVLSTFFFTLTLLAYVRYAEGRSPKSEVRSQEAGGHSPQSTVRSPKAGVWYGAALGLFALGLMSKPMLVTVPFVLLLLDFWPLGRIAECGMGSAEPGEAGRAVPSAQRASENVRDERVLPASHGALGTARPTFTPLRRLLVEKVPFFILAGVSSAVTFWVQKAGGTVTSLEAVPLEFRIANALISYVRYAAKMIWPAKLAVFYPAPAEWPIAWVAGAALVLAGVSVLTVRWARKAPYLAFGWFWYLGILAPVIGIVQVGQQAMADRYSYVPLIGLFVAIVWSAAEIPARWPGTKNGLAVCAAAAVAACAVLTWNQAGYWRNTISLFEHDLAVTDDNAVAHNNLGTALLDAGDATAAAGHFAEVVRLKANYSAPLAEALVNLGVCRQKQDRLAEAGDLYRRSLERRPSAPAHYNLANLLSQQGQLEEAEAHYRAALRLKPEFVEARYNLGLLEAKRGRMEEAAQDYAAALRIKPDHAEAHLSLGALLAGQKRLDEAIAHFQAAVQAAPDKADAHFNLAAALNAKGDFAGAAAQFEAACRLRPDDVEARENLGLALLYGGRMSEAARQFREVLRLRPDARSHYYLALALDSEGQTQEAVSHYRAAARLSPNTPLYLNDLAWFLATNPKAELRDGAEAVRLAERACRLSGGKEARFWGTLDAAYAEAGRFTEAMATAAKVRGMALAAGQPDTAKLAQERLALYRAGKPYRRAAPPQSQP